MPRLKSTASPSPTLRPAHSVQDRLADYAEAMALAEAGEQLLAADLMEQTRIGRRRILVIGHGCSFSERLGQYALGVAERMGSDLLFLSVGMPNSNPDWRGSFAHLAARAAATWQEAAARHGVNMLHEIRFGSVDEAVSELVRNNGRIEFILSEPEEGGLVQGHTGLALFTIK